MHHVFQIGDAFLDAEIDHRRLEYEMLVVSPPDAMTSSAAIADWGNTVRERFARWWTAAQSSDFSSPADTYYGPTSRHETLERTVWHSLQHVRQIAALLESIGITPDAPPTPADCAGLPITEKIWDEG